MTLRSRALVVLALGLSAASCGGTSGPSPSASTAPTASSAARAGFCAQARAVALSLATDPRRIRVLIAAAPAELKGDIQTIADVADKAFAALAAANGDSSKAQPELDRLGADPAYQAAAKHFRDYLTASCGFTSSPTS